MKIALITDQHFGVRNDSIQFHEYFSKFYSEFFFPFLQRNNIKTIVELGDLFDRRKYINFDSLSRSLEYWFDPIKKANIDLHCIVGNHDIYYKNTNRINSPNLLLKDYQFNVYE
jgi:metallophosphoesterase superfamily enzyme